jgi:hypothetical protein
VPLDLNPRNSWVPDCKRRRIDLRSLITGVVISPWAEDYSAEEIKHWVKSKGFPNSMRNSELASAQTPSLNDFRAMGPFTSSRVSELKIAEKCPVTKEELHQFSEALSKVPTSHVQFLYRHVGKLVA